MTIHDLLSAEPLDLPSLRGFLDGLDTATRVRQIRSLRAPEQAMLFEAVQGFRPLRLTDLVSAEVAPLREVVHYGRNSLPALYRFEKRFCSPNAGAGELWGYNEHPLRPLIGPGYFIARQQGELEVVIDYSRVPPARPPSWPKIVPNSSRLGSVVYGGLRDVVRGVSRHVTIGRATRGGKPLDNWFVLCRSDGGPANLRTV